MLIMHSAKLAVLCNVRCAERERSIRKEAPRAEAFRASYEGIGARSVNGCLAGCLGFHVVCPAM